MDSASFLSSEPKPSGAFPVRASLERRDGLVKDWPILTLNSKINFTFVSQLLRTKTLINFYHDRKRRKQRIGS